MYAVEKKWNFFSRHFTQQTFLFSEENWWNIKWEWIKRMFYLDEARGIAFWMFAGFYSPLCDKCVVNWFMPKHNEIIGFQLKPQKWPIKQYPNATDWF